MNGIKTNLKGKWLGFLDRYKLKGLIAKDLGLVALFRIVLVNELIPSLSRKAPIKIPALFPHRLLIRFVGNADLAYEPRPVTRLAQQLGIATLPLFVAEVLAKPGAFVVPLPLSR